MSALPLVRRALAASLVALLAVSLTSTVATADHAGPPGPIHAGNTFGWYQYGVQRHEFVGRLPGFWKRKPGSGNVRIQHGMLTLNTGTKGDTSATLALKGHETGRWEVRLRARRYGREHANYRVLTELIPGPAVTSPEKERCGAQNIGINSFQLGKNTAKFFIHTLPNNTFRAFKGRNLGNDRWHTYAVEVAKDHISWFVDAHVVATERRPEALSGVPLTLRFTMKAKKGQRMNPSRMQMDWMRYWSMRAPNEKSIKAPQTEKSTFADAC